MRITFGGDLLIGAPQEKVLAFLNDLESVAVCIPDSDGFKKSGPKACTMNVRVGLGFVKGSFAVKCDIVESRQDAVSYRISSSGIGSNVNVLLSLKLKGKGQKSTDIAWASTADLSGLVSGVSETVIRKVTEEKIREIVANAKLKMEKGV